MCPPTCTRRYLRSRTLRAFRGRQSCQIGPRPRRKGHTNDAVVGVSIVSSSDWPKKKSAAHGMPIVSSSWFADLHCTGAIDPDSSRGHRCALFELSETCSVFLSKLKARNRLVIQRNQTIRKVDVVGSDLPLSAGVGCE